jgi:predicted Zn-dependent protease
VTEASEIFYLAVTAKADLRTGVESLRKAIENLQILLDGDPRNETLLAILKQLRVSLKSAEKASERVFAYVRSLP